MAGEIINPIDLPSRIKCAQAAALTEAELEEIKDKQDRVTRDFLAKKITFAQFKEQMEACSPSQGVVRVPDLVSFKSLLQTIGLEDETVEAILQDERPHCEQVIALGLTPGLQVQFLRLPDTTLDMYPSTIADLPDDMEDQEARDKLRRIIEAQTDLSDRDKSQLGIEAG